MMEGLLVIISGPSGAGKGTVVKALPSDYALSISATTRSPRPGETHGKEYFFVSKNEFAKMQEEDNLLEYAEYVGNFYGTPRKYVEEQISMGKIVILEIEVVGALQIKEKLPGAVLIFIVPPTLAELERRLIGRNTEEADVVEYRLSRAVEEVGLVSTYDYLVVNDNINDAVRKIKTIVNAEKLKPSRSKAMINGFI